MFKIIQFILFTLIATNFLYAQSTFEGKVVNIENAPIEYANIVLLNESDSSIVNGTFSDSTGFFKVSSNLPNVILQVSSVGYLTKTMKVDNTHNLGELVLSFDQKLKEVVVRDQNIFEKKEDKFIFHVSDSPLEKESSSIEMLQKIPMIWVDHNNQILLRQEAVTILINGRRLNLKGDALSEYLNSLLTKDIDRVEIQTNNSAENDGDITGSVINIVLKKESAGYNLNLKTYYSTYFNNLYDLNNSMSFNYAKSKWQFYFTLGLVNELGKEDYKSNFLIKESLENQTTEGYYDHKINNNVNSRLGTIFKISPKQEAGLEFYIKDDNLGLNNNNNLLISDVNNIPKVEGKTYSTYDISTQMVDFILNYSFKLDTLGSKVTFVGDYINHTYNNDLFNSSEYDSPEYDGVEDLNKSNNLTEMYSIQSDLNKKFISGLNLLVGIKHLSTLRDNVLDSKTVIDGQFVPNERTNHSKNKEYINSAYTSISYSLGENYIKIGLRGEHTQFENNDLTNSSKVNGSYLTWLPSIYYSSKLKNDISISLSYSKRLTRPSFRILNNNVNKINDYRYDIGNPNLTPELLDKYEFTLSKRNHNLSFYFNHKKDVITGLWSMENDIAVHQNVNNGTTQQYGVEYNYNKKITEWWKIKLIGELFERKIVNQNLNQATAFFYMYNGFSLNKTMSIDLFGNYMSPFLSGTYFNAENYSLNLIIKKSFLNNKLNTRLYLTDILNSIRVRNESEFQDSYFDFYQKKNTRSIVLWLSYTINSKNKSSKKKRNISNNQNKHRL
ncbi:outer membrane beta-barrel family protein [Flammeovirga aprica]|uniref:TonB-dependent receptor n=1 Tax=Flammeovirga aprica JL-4 TaxID=694437 RepID=A0A7X9S1T8_9BACT|nr:outer membrane beta-barrel family protein [Flammeovirga aprica]NME72726.1 TonB-dependent receptor [Flammeovirga aprica JL-4]